MAVKRAWIGFVVLGASVLAGCYSTRGGEDDLGAAGGAAQPGNFAQAGTSPMPARPPQQGVPMTALPMTPPMTMPPMSGGGTPPSIPMTVAPVCSPKIALTARCADCACTAGPDCLRAMSVCDRDCWALISCVYNVCGSGSNTSCIAQQCSGYFNAAMPAQLAGTCVRPCVDSCAFDLGGQVPDPDQDAGF